MLAETGKARLRAMSEVSNGLMRYAGVRLLSPSSTLIWAAAGNTDVGVGGTVREAIWVREASWGGSVNSAEGSVVSNVVQAG